MVKAKTISLNQCAVTIRFNRLALNADYTDEKVGIKSVKRTIHLPYLGTDGLIYIPAQKWLFGWLKSFFGNVKDIRSTSVRFKSGEVNFPIGRADKLLEGIPSAKWVNPESAAPYVLDEELTKLGLYPNLEWVISTDKKSRTKLYYLLSNASGDMMDIPLEIISTLQPKPLEDIMRKAGRALGMGPRAACARHGVFDVIEFKSREIGIVNV